MTDGTDHAPQASGTAERIFALVLLVIGLAALYGGWSMDRLAMRQIHPASIPGLVPMILGGLLSVAAIIFFISVPRSEAGAPTASEGQDRGVGTQRDFFVALVLCLVYALGLVSRVPFFVATAMFIGAFVLLLSEPKDGTRFALRSLASAAAFGIISSGAIALLFRYAFLVRLP